MGKEWKQWQVIFLGSKITADGDCSHEIKRCLLLGRKAMTNVGSILKCREMNLLTMVRIVKATVFRVVKYGCENWTIKKAEHWRTDVFELWCCSILLRVPWSARRSNQPTLKGNESWIFIGRIDAEVEALILWLPDAKSQLIGKDPDTGKYWRQEKEEETEDETVAYLRLLIFLPAILIPAWFPHPYGRNWRWTKSLLMKVKEESE